MFGVRCAFRPNVVSCVNMVLHKYLKKMHFAITGTCLVVTDDVKEHLDTVLKSQIIQDRRSMQKQ